MRAVTEHAQLDPASAQRSQGGLGVRAQIPGKDLLIRPTDHACTPQLVRRRRAATALGDPLHRLFEVTLRTGRPVGEGCTEHVVQVVDGELKRGGDAFNSGHSLGAAGAHRQGAVEVENHGAHDHDETLTCSVADGDLVTYYKLRAPEYDQVYDRPDRQQDLRSLERLLPLAVAGRRVLELAAGTGYWTPLIAAVADSVVATDINPETLAIAKARDYKGGNVDFRIADAYAPHQVHGDFDCIVAGYFLSHVPRGRVAPFLKAVVDRVGAGGRIVLFDNLRVDDSNLPISRTDEEGNTFQQRQLGSGQSFEVLKNFYDGAGLERLVRPYASTIDVQPLTYYWLLTFDIG
jgi:SAM-dependent methyltransferase